MSSRFDNSQALFPHPPSLSDSIETVEDSFSLAMRGSAAPLGTGFRSSSSSPLCTCIDSTPPGGGGGGGGGGEEAALPKLIHDNKPRLAYFEEESNIGKGFIKVGAKFPAQPGILGPVFATDIIS